MRYLILSAVGSGGKTVAGFLSFMITEEDECEVVYWYDGYDFPFVEWVGGGLIWGVVMNFISCRKREVAGWVGY